MNKIGLIILNWNSYENTKNLLDNILPYIKKSSLHADLFLIDNDSKDQSGEKLAREFTGNLHYYNTGYNSGYTGGNNFGIIKAIERDCDYVLILNNDLKIENFSLILDSIGKVFDANSQIGIIGFDIFNQMTKKILGSGGNADRIFNKLLNINTKKIFIDEYTTTSSQRSVCGCAICFKTACINDIGLFDENFFMYAEEQDICLRAINAKWDVVKIESNSAKIYRKIDPISEKQLIWYYETRNIFSTYRKNLGPFNKYIFSLIQLFICFKQIIRFFFNKKSIISLKIIRVF